MAGLTGRSRALGLPYTVGQWRERTPQRTQQFLEREQMPTDWEPFRGQPPRLLQNLHVYRRMRAPLRSPLGVPSRSTALPAYSLTP